MGNASPRPVSALVGAILLAFLVVSFIVIHGGVALGVWIAMVAVSALLVAAATLLFWRARKRLEDAGLEINPAEGVADAAAAEALQAGLRDQLERLREDGSPLQLKTVRASEPGFPEIPADQRLVSRAAGRLARRTARIVEALPSGTSVVGISVEPTDPERGQGITFTARAPGGDTARETIREQDFGLPDSRPESGGPGHGDRLNPLLEAGAIWIAFELEEAAAPGTRQPLGTTSWRSYANFALGEGGQRGGAVDFAEARYLEALELDRGNQGAKLNLAALYLEPPRKSGGRRHAKRLKRAGRMLREVWSAPGRSVEVSLRARYVMSIVLLERGKRKRAAASANRAWKIVRHADPSRTAGLPGMLREPTRILRKSIELERARKRKKPPQDPRVRTGWVSPAEHYNLACYFARKNSHWPRSKAKGPALSELAAALNRGDDALREWAKRDPALESVRGARVYAQLVYPPAIGGTSATSPLPAKPEG